jgi:hypothetical protein
MAGGMSYLIVNGPNARAILESSLSKFNRRAVGLFFDTFPLPPKALLNDLLSDWKGAGTAMHLSRYSNTMEIDKILWM